MTANPRSSLFGTVPKRDYLQFWQSGLFQPQRVARFLGLSKNELAAGGSRTRLGTIRRQGAARAARAADGPRGDLRAGCGGLRGQCREDRAVVHDVQSTAEQFIALRCAAPG